MNVELCAGLTGILASVGASTEVLTDGTGATGYAWRGLLILFFVLLNGFFVAAEFALVKVHSSQLDESVEKGNRNALRAREIVNRLDDYLSATQLGITLSSLALGVLVEPLATAMLQPLFAQTGMQSEALLRGISLVVALGIITTLHVILGELLPKSFAIRRALPTTLFIARPMRLFHLLFKPAIVVFNSAAKRLLKWVFHLEPVAQTEMFHSADELRILLNETEKSEEVTPIEREILMNAMELNDLLARDIMTPRNDVISLDVNKSLEANFQNAIESRHTRFPLVDGHLDDFLGLVHVKDLLGIPREGDSDLRTILRPLEPIPEMMPLDKLLQLFLEKRAHMALVVDEYGGSLGIVTLDNVLEELVGDISDEFDNEEDEESQFVRLNDNEFVVEGTLGLYELDELAGLKLEDPDVTTVGGFVTHLLGHLPEVGEDVEIQGYNVTITESDGRTVGKLLFRRLKSPSEEESDQEEAA